MKKYLRLLTELPLFDNIAENDVSEMLKCMQANIKVYNKDEFIRTEGDPADFIGIVLNGTINILQYDYNGNRTITASFSQGSIFAEAVSFAEVLVLPFSIQAVTECEIMIINKNKVLNQCCNACAFHSRLIQNLLKVVARNNMQLNQKLNLVSRRTTSEKILFYLADQAKLNNSREFRIPFDRQTFADYLGVERSALSAEISKLQKNGILETRRSWFRLL